MPTEASLIFRIACLAVAAFALGLLVGLRIARARERRREPDGMLTLVQPLDGPTRVELHILRDPEELVRSGRASMLVSMKGDLAKTAAPLMTPEGQSKGEGL